ncbi:hypothetical protein M378DRAFT_182221 [Amanita muscaria Koide BX008]|uniref:HAT C-terminal dimerisation domain-containing protein n=1 Tax=Amanita muscaria (strain Koide BX008) TaxID=946122 RepID=A0A0C2RYU3_AMAMK|nr:hypothetical protein M378DRAFT_182221 [Amanita muscaria Koide BX008]
MFSSEHKPTLWRVLPQIEELLTAWELKLGDNRFKPYHAAISDGIEKIKKYYNKMDARPAYILSLASHPWFKLDYFEHQWGGAKEQQEDIRNGNPYAKNWQDEARKVLEKTMEVYWQRMKDDTASTPIPRSPTTPEAAKPSQGSVMTSFARHHQARMGRQEEEGWAAEMRRFLRKIENGVSPDTEIIKWWQDHATDYPILSRIALNVLPAQASSVPCERLFSASKQAADDRRARLGTDKFEQTQIMKFAWREGVTDYAAINSSRIEECDLDEYVNMLGHDMLELQLDAGFRTGSAFRLKHASL